MQKNIFEQFICSIEEKERNFVAFLAYPTLMPCVAITAISEAHVGSTVFFNIPMEKIHLLNSLTKEELVSQAILLFQRSGWPSRLVGQNQEVGVHQFNDSF